jgi:hypothetical protein
MQVGKSAGDFVDGTPAPRPGLERAELWIWPHRTLRPARKAGRRRPGAALVRVSRREGCQMADRMGMHQRRLIPNSGAPSGFQIRLPDAQLRLQ